MIRIRSIKAQIVRYILAQPQQFFLRSISLRPNIPLQRLPLFDLPKDQHILFGAVAAEGFQRFMLILRLHPRIAGDGIDFAAIIDGNKAAPVAFGEPETVFF